MTAPSVSIPADPAVRGRARIRTDRFGQVVEAWLRAHTVLV
jgi:hypothetical protein